MSEILASTINASTSQNVSNAKRIVRQNKRVESAAKAMRCAGPGKVLVMVEGC